jgi:hypothetical protein
MSWNVSAATCVISYRSLGCPEISEVTKIVHKMVFYDSTQFACCRHLHYLFWLCVQALFRPVSMCVPDMALIVEIMLMSEGFNMSKMLSRKFVILYRLCEDLLSKSKHYDWKLRAIKTTLYVAGGMKRSAPDLSEDKVFLQLHCTAS